VCALIPPATKQYVWLTTSLLVNDHRERWVLRKVAGEDSVRLEPWVDGEVGWPSH
jgi:hypothetical protein